MKFNFFSSLPFWGAFCLIVVLTRPLGSRPPLRRLLLLIASLLMILSIPGFTPLNLVSLLALGLFSYAFCRILSDGALVTGTRTRRWLSIAGITGVLAFLAFYKYGFIQSLILGQAVPGQARGARIAFMIGVSYFSFKMIHAIVESYRRKIERPSLGSYFLYILFFPSFISGPINRYNQFEPQVQGGPATDPKKDFIAGGERIVHGLFKKFVLAQILFPHILTNEGQAVSSLSPGAALLGLYAYALYFYFDFSGYSDLAIGSARILGIQLPENFNNPFLKKNIRELWTNWHMSLTGWLVDYIYWPLVRKLRDRAYLRERPVLLSNLGMIVTFIACGMWHGEAAHFLIWGAYHGLGISVLTIYQRQKRKVKNDLLRRYFRSKASAIAGMLLTFNFFALGLALFVLDLKGLRSLLDGLF
jgi:alginate O-acetyltransferase complex protein AlgI